MNVEDPNFYMSRFSEETWAGFVEARKPKQVVCNLHAAESDLPCLEVDVKSCRLNGIVEGNVADIPVFSPLDEFKPPKEGVVADYSWVDLGKVKSSLISYIWDGPRWYCRAEVLFMLSTLAATTITSTHANTQGTIFADKIWRTVTRHLRSLVSHVSPCVVACALSTVLCFA